MPAYGLRHILWLMGIAGTSAALCFGCRRKWVPHRSLRIVLAFSVAAIEIERTLHDGLHFPGRMPLNLCNISAWAAVAALLTLNARAVEFTYFEGLAGAAMALVVPDMGSSWPTRFFLNHGAMVITASALVFGRIIRLRRGAVWRAFGMGLIYVALLGAYDWAFRTNYGYLRSKPRGVTPMNLLGPWPIYILGAMLLGLAIFMLLWIPARKSAS